MHLVAAHLVVLGQVLVLEPGPGQEEVLAAAVGTAFEQAGVAPGREQGLVAGGTAFEQAGQRQVQVGPSAARS